MKSTYNPNLPPYDRITSRQPQCLGTMHSTCAASRGMFHIQTIADRFHFHCYCVIKKKRPEIRNRFICFTITGNSHFGEAESGTLQTAAHIISQLRENKCLNDHQLAACAQLNGYLLTQIRILCLESGATPTGLAFPTPISLKK